VLSRSRGSGWVSFGYDLGDRVVTVGENNTLQATHRYDGLGRRTKTTKANGDQRFQIYTQGGQFVWEGDFVSSQGVASGVNYVNLNGSLIAKLVADWSLPAQRDGDGRPTKLSGVFRNVFADAGATSIVAPADGSTPQRLADVPVTYHLRYVHTDALGSPVVETNAIGEEITGTRTLYEPYGTPLTTPRDGAPSYTGHQYDTGTGLIYAQQRYYDPQLGVFMSPDPMAVDTTSAFNFNRYAYANNSPYKFTDPDGRRAAMSNTLCDIGGCDAGSFGAAGSKDSATSGSKSDCPECDEVRATRKGILIEGEKRLNEAGVYAAKEGAMMFGGGVFGRVLGKVGRFLGIAGRESKWVLGAGKSEARWAGQLERRGWTRQQITEAIESGSSFRAENLVNRGNSATRYVHPETGRSVVIDDITREVIHVGGDGFKY
jgi:RHS repeat-associated protein